MPKDAKRKPMRRSTKISIGIIITLIIGDFFLTWLYYFSNLSEFWVAFIMFQILATIAVTNYQALTLIPIMYRSNEFYFKNTRKAVNIMGIAFNELDNRDMDDAKVAARIVSIFEFFDKNEKELEAFRKCIIEPITHRITDMTEEDRIAMYRNIGVGVNSYLDDLESFADLSDEEVQDLLARRKRRNLKNHRS